MFKLFSTKAYTQKNKGAAFIMIAFLLTGISITFVGSVTASVIREHRTLRSVRDSHRVIVLAEVGNEDALYRLKHNMSVSGIETITLPEGSVETTVTTPGINQREIISEANIGSHIRRTRMRLSNAVSEADFFYGAQVGRGGLVMRNNSRIEGADGAAGNVYANGPIEGASGTVITGDAIVSDGLVPDPGATATVCNEDQAVGQTSPQIDHAQSFVPGESDVLDRVELRVKKVGTPSDATIRITADNAGQPAATALASATLSAANASTTYTWQQAPFSPTPSLTAGTTYWIVFDTSENSSNYWVWCADINEGYGTGVAAYTSSWTSGGWTNIARDMTFRTYFGAGESLLKNMQVDGTVRAKTIESATIVGDAYYDTISGSSVLGSSYPGSGTPPAQALPISSSQMDEWADDAAAGGVISGNCPGAAGCSTSMGPRKVDGNFTPPLNSTYTLTGVLHVTGNFVPGNNSTIRCDLSFGADSCVLLVDGHVDISNNVTFQGSGHPDSYVLIVSRIEGCLGSSATGCAPNNSGVNISNNAEGAIFYASDSLITVGNNVNLTSVVGYKLELRNNAVITYESGIADASFSAGPGGGWRINDWREVE